MTLRVAEPGLTQTLTYRISLLSRSRIVSAMCASGRAKPGYDKGGRPGTRPARILLAAAIVPAVGLLLLGAVFNSTPIELRYLSFGLPFLAILASQPGGGRVLILAVQAAGITGLLLAPRTMQPARAAALAVAPYVDNAIALIPAGNDGVGIVGAFGIEAPPALKVHLVRPSDPPFPIPADADRVILALLAQDRDSTAALPALRASVAGPNWRLIAKGANLEVYERTGTGGG
jgi:hypothetical protein